MRKALLAAACITFVIANANVPQISHAQIAEAGLAASTVGDFISNLRSLVKQTEDSAHSLIDHGNAALGQQEMVIAGILNQLIQKLSTTYADALGKTFDQISSTERDTFMSIADNLKNIEKLERISNSDVQDRIYQLQVSTNQVLDRLPLTDWTPIFYGMTVSDLTTDPAPSPADIQILGFHFEDPKINSKVPRVQISGTELSNKDISVREDRINIHLPDDLKKKIGFGNSACDPRPIFPMSLTVFYGMKRGFWPISWTSEVTSQFNDNALAGPELYNVQVNYDATRTVAPLIQHSFSARSGYTAMGCEATTSASVRFDLPPGSQEISCAAAWVDTSNVGSSSQNCTVGGTVATGSGSMRGRDKQCVKVPPFGPTICNCPGGGHGNLQISGNYKVPEPKSESMTDIPLPAITLIQQSDAYATFPLDPNLQITKVKVSFSRKSCPSPKDRIELNIPDWRHEWTATSSEGLFSAKIWNGQITLLKK